MKITYVGFQTTIPKTYKIDVITITAKNQESALIKLSKMDCY